MFDLSIGKANSLLFGTTFALLLSSAHAQESTDLEAVNAAHEAYHQAFGAEDLDLLSDVWLHDETVRLIVPPGTTIYSGWEEVREAFEEGLKDLDMISLGMRDVQTIVGEDIAWIVDIHELEMRTPDGKIIKPDIFSTHVFHKVDGRWLMVQHQASAPARPE